MATVTDGVTGDLFEGVTGPLLDYYRSEGDRFTIVPDESDAAAPFPRHYVDGVLVQGPPALAVGEFNPSEHTVEGVLDYVGTVDGDEAGRVLEVERLGKARKGVLNPMQAVTMPAEEAPGEVAAAGEPVEHPMPGPGDPTV